MYRTWLISAVIVASLTSPSFAAAPTLWYVAQKAGTHECWTTTKQPNAKTEFMVGHGWSSHAKALAAMERSPRCEHWQVDKR